MALLVLALAGCSTAPRPNLAHVSDWEDLDAVPAPTASPPPAAPPAQAPPSVSAPPTISTPASQSQPAETWVPLLRWANANGLAAPARLAGGPSPTYGLRSVNGGLVLRAAGQSAYWNGAEVRLGFAPQLIDGQLYVHVLDLKKTLQPLVQGTWDLGLSAQPVIVIDPGHGGEDTGTRSVDNRFEKEFTLDWALRLRALLAAAGWQVFLTRTSDMDLALSNRVAFAEAQKADLFLSLHFNSAAPNQVEAGLETYCLTPVGMPSSLTRGFADEPTAVFPNNAFDAQNLQLAVRVHRALLEVNGNHDRGIRRARFLGVLRAQQRPAVLVEGGYLSNPREAHLIADPAYRQRLAEAVAMALLGKVEGRMQNAEGADVAPGNSGSP